MQWKKKSGLLAVSLLSTLPGIAHVVKYDLDPKPRGNIIVDYLVLGYEHILPLGLDHILFVLCLCLLSRHLKSIILQATMFTLAHSITLGLAMYSIINPEAYIIEPLIAASIFVLALENIFFHKVKPWRLIMVFLFGLVHGMGFAGVLGELGMPRHAFFTALISFNIGVELGQLTVILAMYFLIIKTMGNKPWYRQRVVIPASILIAIIAAYWTIERVFFS